MKKNFLFLLLIITGAQLNAQEFRTDESISQQLKGNTQPGLKYGPAVKPAGKSSKGFTGSSLAREIKEGKFGPLQAGAAGSATKPAVNEEKSAELSSGKSAAEVERELKAAKASKAEAPQLPPTQEEKGEAPLKTKTPAVKKVQQ